MHKLRYAPEAANDLEEIRDYIAQELMNPDAAAHTLEEIGKAAAPALPATPAGETSDMWYRN